MSADSPSTGRIHILPESVFQKIAAGEVIDRPGAIVRELIDNALDAGASEIDCALRSGGLDDVRITDNGAGMTRNELELCFLPHATSKIINAEDIYRISTLGFRGEALGSIAACTRMEVTSRPSADHVGEPSTAHLLRIRFGEPEEAVPVRGKPGTTVSASNLFHTMPGRKKFLKSGRSESAYCRSAFLDKALPFPSVRFRLFSDESLQLLLPPGTFLERVAAAYPQFVKPAELFEISFESEEFSFRLVAGDPSVFRKDRRYIHIFLNRRRIDEYALVQAVEYGFSEFLPGGRFPYGFLFIEDEPSLVDFNIHPAKREVKIRNLSRIHSAVVDEVRASLRGGAAKYFPGHSPQPKEVRERSVPETLGLYPSPPPQADRIEGAEGEEAFIAGSGSSRKISFRYLGQVFGVFLLADFNNRLFIIDQHAAHERILFEKYSRADRKTQRLLFPAYFETSEEVAEVLLTRAGELEDIGISVKPDKDGGDHHGFSHGTKRWKLVEVPTYLEDKESVVIEYLSREIGGSEDLKRDLLAAAACKAAIKDGEVLDSVTATELIDQTLRLEFPRCPHGRVIWYVLSREDLFTLVGRTV
ncbi:MAG: DNA mismatch repair endonuclease MutL [Spirochaetia bacterium]